MSDHAEKVGGSVKFLSKISACFQRTALWAVCFVLSVCGKKDENTSVVQISPTPIEVVVPENVFVADECPRIDENPRINSIPDGRAEISLVMSNVAEQNSIEATILDVNGSKIQSKRICSRNSKELLISSSAQNALATLFARDKISRKLFVIEDVRLNFGSRINFGSTSGASAASIRGRVINPSGAQLKGNISPLGWMFEINPDGTWNTGVLPPGIWNLQINDDSGRQIKWNDVRLHSDSIVLPDASLAPAENSFTPLWSGVLKQSVANFLVTGREDATEMRISLDPTFTNVFWAPFRQVAAITIPSKGRHQVFAQLRNSNGSESEIFVHEITADVLELGGQVDAVLANPNVSVFYPQTTISTIPPAGATQHSFTIDVDELPRTWTSTSVPLELSLPKSLTSCGRHTVYVRFRSAEGNESESLARGFSVSCWDKNLPVSSLAGRYAHGAAAISLANWNDAVFIWGGRNATQLFNDGAILKKNADGWVWQTLPPNTLSPRSKPNIVVGRHHVFVFGGVDLSGNVVPGWAFYNFKTGNWIYESDFDSATKGTPPPSLKNAAVAFLQDINTSYTTGAFLVVGGEIPGQPNASTISDKYYFLVEGQNDLIKTWTQGTAKKAVSRATFSTGSHEGFFYVHSGITTPSGTATTTNPDLSGDDFDLSGDLQVFAYYTKENDPATTTDNQPTIVNNIYKSVNSRTGALRGHTFIATRSLPNSGAINDWMEAQLMCVFSGQKYTDEFPDVCQGLIGGKPKLYEPFCRRLFDSYLFAPVNRLGICFEPKGTAGTTNAEGYLTNFYLAMPGAPKERRLSSGASPSIKSNSMQSGLMIWSGMAPTGGEFLADGSIYFGGSDQWIPMAQFEAPPPRNDFSATFINHHKQILIWGGQTAAGISAQGAFHAMP
ncbi:MAG: hypothetical protein RI953_973 [Pseudomonadota bacterium]|jgi:hypothetical protein